MNAQLPTFNPEKNSRAGAQLSKERGRRIRRHAGRVPYNLGGHGDKAPWLQVRSGFGGQAGIAPYNSEGDRGLPPVSTKRSHL